MTEDVKPETTAVDERPIDVTTGETETPSADQAAAASEAAAPAPEPMTLEQLLEQRQPMIHGLAAVAAVAEAATLKFVAEHANPRVITEADAHVVFTETLRHLLECERMELGKRNQIELMQHQFAMMAAGQNPQRIMAPPPGMGQKLPWRPPVKGNGRH